MFLIVLVCEVTFYMYFFVSIYVNVNIIHNTELINHMLILIIIISLYKAALECSPSGQSN